MELPVGENHGNLNTRIPEQNVHVNNQALTIAEIESMRQQPVYSDPDLQGGNTGCNHSINLISSEQDLQGTNVIGTAAETEQMMIRQQQSGQRQPAEIYSADSSEQNRAETEHLTREQQSGQRQLPDTSTADSPAVQLGRLREAKRKAKRKADQRYRENKKKKLEDMELKLRSLEAEREKPEAENKSLKEQLDFKQRELDKLREDFIELETKYKKQHEQQAGMEHKVTTLEAENRSLMDKYIKLLEKSNALMDSRLERDFSSSGIDSITQ
ncbi:hypothetical protein SLEP1_g53725 [Rubroshorea leprosula]|uniref:BZIP domain-containing protein n=1 Tax=Rubroshorea leprosula TaxID=152421 RepID=A0AAV5MC22_9ROSI|nr:hypothetical protein SLEP1_g53725 [Rubroshorea leprosula]